MWWKGPSWLSNHKAYTNKDIPSFNYTCNPRSETKKFVELTTNNNFELLINPFRFSSWSKMVKTLAYVNKFLNITHPRTNVNDKKKELSIQEIKKAEIKLFFLAQRKSLPTEEEIQSLSMFKDAGLYRCCGRIEKINYLKNIIIFIKYF